MDISPQNIAPDPLPKVVEYALEVGLNLRGSVATGGFSETVKDRLKLWLNRGSAGEMGWLPRNQDNLLHLQKWKPWAQSALLFALPYRRRGGGFRNGGAEILKPDSRLKVEAHTDLQNRLVAGTQTRGAFTPIGRVVDTDGIADAAFLVIAVAVQYGLPDSLYFLTSGSRFCGRQRSVATFDDNLR